MNQLFALASSLADSILLRRKKHPAKAHLPRHCTLVLGLDRRYPSRLHLRHSTACSVRFGRRAAQGQSPVRPLEQIPPPPNPAKLQKPVDLAVLVSHRIWRFHLSFVSPEYHLLNLPHDLKKPFILSIQPRCHDYIRKKALVGAPFFQEFENFS